MTVTSFNSDKMYTYLRGLATGAGMKQTLKAMSFARDKHSGQFRKSGDPYIIHPLLMACNAVSIGIRDDAVVATILLHDVCEDCGVSLSELPVDDTVRRAVDLMTFRVMDGETKEIAKTATTTCCSRAARPRSPNCSTAATTSPAWPAPSPARSSRPT